jgi:DNA polymerase III epsilon subunit-like protein
LGSRLGCGAVKLSEKQLISYTDFMTTIQPAFIDFEASSLDLIASYPIEVGICMPDGTLHCWLIAPHVLWQDWSENAEQIHGISRETLEADGIAVGEVARALNELLPEQVFCDAWTFDSFWLHRLFRAARISPAFQLESISALLDTRQVRQWSALRQQVIAELGLPVHRAANDALILHKTWERIAEDHGTLEPLTGQSYRA